MEFSRAESRARVQKCPAWRKRSLGLSAAHAGGFQLLRFAERNRGRVGAIATFRQQAPKCLVRVAARRLGQTIQIVLTEVGIARASR
jgi:hypothetical protein